MKPTACSIADGTIRVAGSATMRETVSPGDCDIVEIRLDLWEGTRDFSAFSGFPLLFTARRPEEGGNGNLSTELRSTLLADALDQAACVDIEVASIGEMEPLIRTLAERGIPWVASFHDFGKLPDDFVLKRTAAAAKQAGAAVFKAAARLHSPEDVARLARFQLQDHGIAVATMGMGALASVSRLLCAQCGSVLNYGYLGETPTAPGQWSARELKTVISSLTPVRK